MGKGKYDDLIGGGKIVVDVMEVLDEESASKVDKQIKDQKTRIEKPVKINVDVDDSIALKKLNKLTQAIKNNKAALKNAIMSGQDISDISGYINTHKQLEKQIQAVSKEIKNNNKAIGSSKRAITDAKKLIDSLSVSVAKVNNVVANPVGNTDKTIKTAISSIAKFQKALDDLNKKYGEESFGNIFGNVISAFASIDESNALQVYDALIAKDREYQRQLEKENELRKRIAQETQSFAEATKFIYQNGEPSQDVLKSYTVYWEKISSGAMSAADAVKAFEEEWNQLGGAVNYAQKKQIDEIRMLVKNQKDWLKYLDQSLNADNYKTTGKREAANQLRELTHSLQSKSQNNYANDPGEYAREMAEVAWVQGYREAERQGVAQSTLNRYYSLSAMSLYEDNLKTLQEEYDFREKLLNQRQDELNKITEIVEVQKELLTTPSGQITMFEGMTDSIEKTVETAKELGNVLEDVVKIPGQIDFNEVVHDIESASKSVKKLFMHAGYLGDIENTLPSLPLGHVIPTVNGSGVGGLTGLYTISNNPENMKDSNGFAYNEWHGAKLSAIDPSFYNLFDATNDSRADQLGAFIGELHAAIYGFAMDAFTGDMVDPSTLKTVEELYAMLKSLVNNINMDFEEFKKFVEDSQSIVSGTKFKYQKFPSIDEGIAKSSVSYLLQGVSEEVFNSDSFGTQLLKKLGFEGYDVSGTKYDGTYTGGSVVFTIKPESIVSRDEKWSDVMKSIGFDVSENDLTYEKKRAQLDIERANAYRKTVQISGKTNEVEKFDIDVGNMILPDESEEFIAEFQKVTLELRGKVVQGVHTAETAYEELSVRMADFWESLQTDAESVTRKFSNKEYQQMIKDIDLEKFFADSGINKEDQDSIRDEFVKLGEIVAAKEDGESSEETINEQISNLLVKIRESASIQKENYEWSLKKRITDAGKIFFDEKTITDVGKNNWDEIKTNLGRFLTSNKYGKGVMYGTADQWFKNLSQDLKSEIIGIFESSTERQWNGNRADILTVLSQIFKTAKKQGGKYTSIAPDEAHLDAIEQDASALISKTVNNVEEMVRVEEAVNARLEEQNAKRKESIELAGRAAQQINDEKDNLESSDENNVPDIIKSEVERELKVLREALKNRTNLIDLSQVYSPNELQGQLSSMAQEILGEKSLLEFESAQVDEKVNSAVIKLRNKELGVTVQQMWGLGKAAAAAGDEVDAIIEEDFQHLGDRIKYSRVEAEAYAKAQQKLATDSDKWLIDQQKRANALERSYKHSGKKIDGDTKLVASDETTLAGDVDKTINNLAAHIKNTIQSKMGNVVDGNIRNKITQDLNALENEIKIQQYENYASTELQPSELSEARKQLVSMMDTLKSKANTHNVFSVIKDDFDELYKRLTDEKVQDYIKSGTGISEAASKIKTLKAKNTAAMAGEQETKREEQNLQNILTLQERLYEAKKKFVELEVKGELGTSEGQKASRNVENLEKQYQASLKLLKNTEDRNAALQYQERLEKELGTVRAEQEAKQDNINEKNAAQERAQQTEKYYQSILETVNKINSIDSKINELKFKDGGSGIYSGLIEQLESEKNILLNRVNQIGDDINREFNGVFRSVDGVDRISFSFDSLLKNTNAYNTLIDFFNDVNVRATLSTEKIEKFVQAIDKSQNIELEFKLKIDDQFESVEKLIDRLKEINKILGDNSNLGDNAKYQEIIRSFDHLKEVKAFGDTQGWSANGLAYFEQGAKQIAEYTNELIRATEQERKYFANKQKVSGKESYDDYTKSLRNELSTYVDKESAANKLPGGDIAATKKQKLEEYIAEYSKGKGIITDFIETANGINKINFSILDDTVGTIRTFTVEIGQFSDNIYQTETTMKNLTGGTDAAKKALGELIETLFRLKQMKNEDSNLNIDAQIAELEATRQALESQLLQTGNSKNVFDQMVLKNMALEANNSVKELAKLEAQWRKTQDAIENGSLEDLGSINKNGNIEAQMIDRVKVAAAGARIAIQGFDEKTNTLTYTIVDANGNIKDMTAKMDALTGTVTAQTGKVDQLGTAWGGIKGGFKSIAKEGLGYVKNLMGFVDIVRYLKQGFEAVKEIDAALTELKKVTNETDETYANFLQTMSQAGARVGSTVTDLTTSAADWARLGYSIEEAGKLAENTMILMNVSEFDNVSEATDTLISAIQAFKTEGMDIGTFSMEIIDIFNKIGNSYAISTSDLADSLTRSSAALVAANNSLEESVALTTAGNTIAQDPEAVGNALKTVSMRIRGVKTELEAAGEDTEGMVTNTSKLQDKIMALTNIDGTGGIDILTNTGEFKSTYEILLAISKVWDHMDDASQAALLELIAGKNRASIISGIFQNGDILESAYESATNADGSATEELGTHLDSVEGHINQLNNAVQTMWMNFMESDAVKIFIDIAKWAVEAADSVGLLNAAIGAFVGYNIGKSTILNAFKSIDKGTFSLKDLIWGGFKGNEETGDTIESTAIKNAAAAANTLADASKNAANAINNLANAGNNAATADNNEANASNQAANADYNETNASNASAASEIKEVSANESAVVSEMKEAAANEAATASELAEIAANKTAAASESTESATNAASAATNVASNVASSVVATKVAKTGAQAVLAKGGSKLAASILGGLKGIIASIIISIVIKGIGKLWTWAKNGFKSQKKLAEEAIKEAEAVAQKADELAETYKTQKANFSKNLNDLTGVESGSDHANLLDEFEELTKGVNKYGENISLTSDEYSRYKDICETIVGINPEIAAGYDSATEAIGNNASILERLIELQKEEARLNAAEFIGYGIYSDNGNFETLANSAINDYNEKLNLYSNADKGYTGTTKEVEVAYETTSGSAINTQSIKQTYFDNYSNSNYDNWRTTYDHDRLSEFELDYTAADRFAYMFERAGFGTTTQMDHQWQKTYQTAIDILTLLGEEDPLSILNQYKNDEGFDAELWFKDYAGVFSENQAVLASALREGDVDPSAFLEWADAYTAGARELEAASDYMIDVYLQVPYALKEYEDLSLGEKSFITEWIKNNEIFKIDENTTQDDILKAKQIIINTIRAIANNDYTTEIDGVQVDAQTILDQLFNIDASTVDYAKYREQVRQLIEYLWNAIGGENNTLGFTDQNALALSLGFDFVFDEGEESDTNKFIKRAQEITGMNAEEIQKWMDSQPASVIKAMIQFDYSAVASTPENPVTMADLADMVIPDATINGHIVSTYSALSDELSNFNDILNQTNEIVANNTKVTQEYKDSLIELGISNDELNEYLDESNELVVTNAKGLRKLIAEKKKELAADTKLAKAQSQLEYYDLVKQFDDVLDGMNDLDSVTVDTANSILDQIDVVQQAIYQYQLLEDQLLGTTNAFEAFQQAQEVDQQNTYGDDYESMAQTMYDAFYKTGEVGTEANWAAIEALVPEEVYAGLKSDADRMQAIYEYFNEHILPTLTLDEDQLSLEFDNIEDFVNQGLTAGVFEGTTEEFNLVEGMNLERAAELMGMTTTQAYAFFAALDKYNTSGTENSFLSQLDDSLAGDIMKITNNMEELNREKLALLEDGVTEDEQSRINEINEELGESEQQLNELGAEAYNTWQEYSKNDAALAALSSVEDKQRELTLKDATKLGLEWDEVSGMTVQEAYDYLLAKQLELEEPTILTAELAIENIDTQIANLQTELNDPATSEQRKIEIQAEIQGLEDDKALLATTFGIELSEEEKTTLQEELNSIEEFTINDKSFKVIINGVSGVNTALQNIKDYNIPDKTVTVKQQFVGGGGGHYTYANGTAHAQGSGGVPKTETALVGELGPEMLVRNGRWTTVGDNGAEFTQVKKGDIIFNHKQTEELLSKGYVTGRGKAYASGTAYSGLWKPTSPDDTSGSEVGDAASKLSKAAEDISDSADEFKEIFDWIEVRLEEINEDLDLKNAELENAVGSTKQNSIIDNMIELNQKLYNNLTAGASKYYEYAAKLLKNVPEEYRKAAQDGSIAIESFVGEVGEETLQSIEDYREWVQKGADATQQAEETLTEISSLAKQAIDNIASDYENKVSLRDGKIEQYEAFNALLETDVGYESAKIYQAMIKENDKIITTLQEQHDKMQAELNAQVEAGNIKKYSQDWYDAVNDIAALDTEIIELKTNIEDWQDAINELHWDQFDFLIDQIQAVADEAENLIDILDNKDVVDEAANWTKEGITSLGLYAQQMEVAEMQAKEYKEEINYLNKNWQKLGYTEQEYVEKLEELKDGQYDAIQSYYDAKDAIVDLNSERVDAIKEGIEKEIEAYSELIEKKKEALDAEKDLYDFQKDVKKQNKDIADLERQLAALAGDSSASARAKRAQLEAELIEARATLEDTYYNRSVDNQQTALDKELENFQDAKDKEIEGWEEYLENTELVISDSLATIQANTDVVYQTLKDMGNEYGLSITESLTSPWKEGEYAIQSYTEKFKLNMSATVEELKALAVEFNNFITEIETSGTEAVTTVQNNATNYQSSEYKPVATGGSGSSSGNSGSDSSSGGNTGGGASYPYGKASETKGNIKKGAKGNDVKAIQYALNKLGYGNSGTEKVDGIFGSGTQSAVKSFQKAMGISADGIVGNNTRAKFKAKGYAKGTTGVEKDQWAWIDEIGEELVMHADGNGRLAFMTKGSAVVPHDITENIMELSQLDPSAVLERNRPQIGLPSEIHNTEIHIDNSIAELIHIDNCSTETLPDVKKIVNEALEKHTKQLNNSLKKFAR